MTSKNPRRIKLYRNGDEYFTGKKLVITTNYRNFEQLLTECSLDVGFVIGGVRRIYHLGGKRIRSIDEFIDGEAYVATAGEGLKRIDYLTESDLPPAFRSYSKGNLNYWPESKPKPERRKINKSIPCLLNEGNSELLLSQHELFSPTVLFGLLIVKSIPRCCI
jgi:hypothetical protein